ncbi:yippee-domain-containing protein [Amniculicola lignicola CBS 123094]|uniref:Yippee-domain-containing protein n=1 Tax=Amniculicola lignicola CBS 123094 TaxID=1392246 RepID=A0A6A5VZR7_9PLEO|nr:yippee-domain-containing protein [Amniculicola lignicola CBS 123094]
MTPSIPFPLYLLPNPFRRRRSTSTSSSASPPTSPTSSLGSTSSTSSSSSPPYPQTAHPSYLSPTTTSYLRCHKCLTDLIPTSSIISKGFTGRHGRAYLVAPPVATSFLEPGMRRNIHGKEKGDLPNTFTHKAVPRQLVTGAHTVSDISCRSCGSVLGWKYVWAEEESQRYKVGKFILETRRVVRSVEWGLDGEDGEDGDEDGDGDDDEGFNSEDEDECEELFLGIWDAENAKRRRQKQRAGFTTPA